MTTDGTSTPDSKEAEMLPDEAAVLPERGLLLDETDDDELVTVDEAADELDIDFE